MLWKYWTQYASKFGKLSSGQKTGKGQFSFQSQRKAMPKNVPNYHTIALISHASKVMLKILQARLQQYINQEPSDIQVGFRRGRGSRYQIANIHWIMEKAREFQKKISTSVSLSTLKFWLCGWQQTGKFLKRWEYQTILPVSGDTCIWVKKKQL